MGAFEKFARTGHAPGAGDGDAIDIMHAEACMVHEVLQQNVLSPRFRAAWAALQLERGAGLRHFGGHGSVMGQSWVSHGSVMGL